MNIKETKQTSITKQRLLSLSGELTGLVARILKIKYIAKGSIYDQKKKCGNKNCKCARGKLHSTKLLSFSHEGKTHLIPLTKYSIFELYRIEKQVKYYRQFRSYRARIVRDFKLFMEEVNKLEKGLLIEVSAKKGGEDDGQK